MEEIDIRAASNEELLGELADTVIDCVQDIGKWVLRPNHPVVKEILRRMKEGHERGAD